MAGRAVGEMLEDIRFLREYVQPILERYVRRFGYISENEIALYYERINDKYGFYEDNKTHRYPPIALEKYGLYAQGDFCKVSYSPTVSPVGYDHYRFSKKRIDPCCPRCGSDFVYWIDNEIRHSDGKWWGDFMLSEFIPVHRLIGVCRNPLCAEVSDFMEGKHSVAEQASKLKIKLKRPLKAFRQAPEELKGVVAVSGLIDFEARYKEKLQQLDNTPRLLATNSL